MRPSSKLNSYQANRTKSIQSKRFVEKKNTRLQLEIVLSVFVVALFLFCLSKFSYLSAFTIDNFSVSGVGPELSSTIEAKALDNLQGAYINFIAKANTAFYPRRAISDSIAKSFPSVKSVSVARDGLHGLNISIVQKDSVAVVCSSLPDLSNSSIDIGDNDDCYMVDHNGYIFGKYSASTSTADVSNRYYIPALADAISTTSSIVGNFATSTAEFSSLQDFYNKADNAGLKPIAILAKDGGEYEMYVDNIVVYFNDSSPFGDQLANLIAFWNKDVAKTVGDAKQSSYEYIDVRYGSNVFYRKMK